MQGRLAAAGEVLAVFFRLGLGSFGGPLAHLGYFHAEFVVRRRWLSESAYADLVALCQFLPGPASSQVGMALGMLRAGYPGALAAWLGFTLPSALLLILLALGLVGHAEQLPQGLLQGLKVVAVAVVAQAVWGMGRSLCPDAPRIGLMLASCCLVLLLPGALSQLGVILGAGLLGLGLPRSAVPAVGEPLPTRRTRGLAAFWLLLFAALLLLLPLAAGVFESPWLARVDAFYRAGSLVFGGGHVVLPLLQAEVVSTGWVDADLFLAGYGAAQAVPGPLFTFAAYLGAVMDGGAGSWRAGLVCLLAIFLPSFLLVAGCLPFWDRLRGRPRVRRALAGINAGVVGLLLAALYHPVSTAALRGPGDVALAVLALLALMKCRQPPWRVVLGCALGGWALAALGAG